jgi:hypothetical protein
MTGLRRETRESEYVTAENGVKTGTMGAASWMSSIVYRPLAMRRQ